jgi:hypothetical protein
MTRTKREQLLIIGVASAAGLFVLNRYAYEPYIAARDAVDGDRLVAAERLADNSRLFQKERTLRKSWSQMQAGGINSAPSEAEGKMLHVLRQWATDAGLRNLSLRPERTNKDFGFVKVTVHATGAGSTATLAKLLWSVESAETPVRVDDVQLSPVKGEGVDDVQVTLTVSTLCAGGDLEQPQRTTGGRQLVATNPGEGRP